MIIDHYAGCIHNISPDGKGLLQDSTMKYLRTLPDDQNEFTRAILSHPKYKAIWDGSDAEMQRQPNPLLFWGRKSKAGLSWISNSKSTRTVHFILDKLTAIDIVQKTPYPMPEITGDGNSSDKFRSVTGRELRWVYRNRHKLEVIKSIQFWENGRPVPPPWYGTGAAIWGQYIPRSSPEWKKQRSRSLPVPVPMSVNFFSKNKAKKSFILGNGDLDYLNNPPDPCNFSDYSDLGD